MHLLKNSLIFVHYTEEIDNDKDEMTPTQMKRYLRITQKMTDAALEMSY